MMPSRALWDSWAWKSFGPPLLIGKTLASVTFSQFQRAEQLLIKEGKAMKTTCSKTKGPEKEVKVAQSCPTLFNPMDSTVHEIFQARILEWVTIPFSRGFSQSRDQTQVSLIAGRLFTS